MQHAVDQPFTQRAAGQGHALYLQLAKDGDQNGQAAWEDQRSLQGQAFDLQLFQTPTLNSALLELLQFGKGDALIHALRHHDLLQRLNGAGCPNADFPAVTTQRIGHRQQNLPRRLFRRVEIFFGQIAIGKETLKPGDTAHRQAKERGSLRACTGHQLGAGTADIHHQTSIVTAGGMGHALIDQPRLVFTANHLHRRA